MPKLVVKTRTDFQQLAEERFLDAKALLAAGRFGGAYYLAGYVVECALKACVAKQTNAGDFPPNYDTVRSGYYTHTLSQLAATADIRSELEKRFPAEWGLIVSWNEEKRYDTQTSVSQATQCVHAIQNDTDPTKGLLPWLRTQW